MPRIFRPALLAVLVLTLASPLVSGPALAQENQDTAPVRVQGTPELEAFVGALRDAYTEANTDAQVEIDSSAGLRGAFDALCAGSTDIVMSTEPISDAQIQACADAGQGFVETVLAHEAVVLIASPAAQLTCLEQAQVLALWQSGTDLTLTWDALGSTTLTDTVHPLSPDANAPASLLFRSLLPAGELREDAEVVADPAQRLEQVQANGSTATTFMTLAEFNALNPDSSVTPLSVQNEGGECIAPNDATVAAGSYPLTRADFLYVNAESAQRADVQNFIQFALGADTGAPALAAAQGYTPATAAAYEEGINSVLNGRTGRTFTRPPSPVTVSSDATGEVRVAGSPLLGDITRNVRRDFLNAYPNATVTTATFGVDAGWQSFCSGEADVLQATRPATDEELALCQQNGIEPFEVDFGVQALVLAVPGGADWVECVTPDEIATMLRAGTDETPAVTTWAEVNPDWPDEPILFVLPPYRTGETDLLVARFVGDLTLNVRTPDVENADALYRLQGVANTSNGFTYAWWTDAQRSEADVRLLALDAGNGCIAPTAETLSDGTYPLSFPLRFIFSQASFAQPLVRAFLWQFYADNTLDALGQLPFLGLDVEAMRTTQRDEVYNMLAAVDTPAPAAGETTGEATPAATEAGTDATTPAATQEPATGEATPAATEEAAPEATPALTETPAQ